MVSNALQWVVEKTNQVVWDSLRDCGRLSGNMLSCIWEKHHMLLMRALLKNLTMFGVLKVLLLLVAID